MPDLKLFNRHLAGACIQAWTEPLHRQPALESPRLHWILLFIHQRDHSIAALAMPFHKIEVPLPQRIIQGNPAAKLDVSPGDIGRKFPDQAVIAAFSIVFNRKRGFQAAAFANTASARYTAYIECQAQNAGGVRHGHGEIKSAEWINPIADHSVTSNRSCVLPTRKMMNSAGIAGATPTSAMNCPASVISGGLFCASHLTKKASLSVAPASAPAS